MTSQKITKGKPSLLGTNILRGGPHLYSADVLTDNWFDNRLTPNFKPKKPKKKRSYLPQRRTEKEQIETFNASGRTIPTHLALQRHKTNTIPSWWPSEPNRGHPDVSPYETIYELTYGDPQWKNKPIPSGKNIFSYPNTTKEVMTTEHREAFKNPYYYAKDTISNEEMESDDDKGTANANNECTEAATTEATCTVTTIPKNRLVSTSLLGVPSSYMNPRLPHMYQAIDCSPHCGCRHQI